MKTGTSVSAKRAKTSRAAGPPDVSKWLNGKIEPVRAGPAYRAGLLLVAVAMLVLPVVYLSLIGVVAFGIYWHAVNDAAVLMGPTARGGGIVAYVVPILVGGILLAFMLKPLLLRRRDDSVPLTLRQQDEPVLFEFVHRLCRALGAPPPVRIDVDLAVNASAGFRGGLRGLVRRDLVLTFGLPLAACLDARQFAGVLAHELGHFSQGSAMRLTYIVRRVNAWFFRVVHARDQWDRALFGASRGGHWVVRLVALTSRGMIWLVRRILWCFMMAGHAVSAMMLRQMEFDADRYECRVAGTRAFGGTFERLRSVAAAQATAFADLTAAWRERRLADDLPAFIRARESDGAAGGATPAASEAAAPAKTRWLDSHPCDADRLAAAGRRDEPGIFAADAPASALFSNFAELSRVATMLFYRRQLGPRFQPGQLTQTTSLVAARVAQEQTHDALERYFHRLVDPRRPIFPAPVPPPPADRRAAVRRLAGFRAALAAQAAAARDAAAQFAAQDERRATLAAARELRTAGFRKSGLKDAAAIDAMSDDALRAAEVAARAACDRAAAVIERAVRVGTERLALALSLEKPVEPPPVPATVAEAPDGLDEGEYELADDPPAGAADGTTAALNGMRPVAADLESLRWHVVGLRALVGRLQAQGNARPLVDAVLWHSRKAAGLLREIYQQLSQVPYPYAAPGKRLSLSGYMIPAMPPPEQVGRVGAAADSAADAYRSLYRRLMADLASRAEEVETGLGLPPVEMPDSSASS